MNKDGAQYLIEACDAYQDAGKQDSYTIEELKDKYPGLSQDTACNWAIYGWPIQNELTVENHMLRISRYIDELREQNKLLRSLIVDRQRLMDEQLTKIENINK